MKKPVLVMLMLTIIISIGAQYNLFQSGPLTSLTRIAALPMVFLWLVYKLQTSRFRMPNPTVLFSVAFLLWTFLSLSWSPDPDFGIATSFTVFSGFVIIFIMWDCAGTNRRVFAICQSFIFGGYLLFVIIVFNAILGNNIYSNRVSGSSLDPNEVSLYMAALLPLAWYLGTSKEPWPRSFQFLNLLFPGAVFVSAVLTASRGGIVTLAVASLILVVNLRSHLKDPATKRFIQAAFVLAIVSLLVMVGTGRVKAQVDRLLGTAGSLKTDSLSGRLPVWAAVTELVSKNPIFGQGAGGVQYADNNATTDRLPFEVGILAHNTVLDITGNYGIIGLLLYAGCFASILIPAQKLDSQRKATIIMFSLAFLVGGNDLTTEFRSQFWMILNCYGLITFGIKNQQPADFRAESRRRRLSTERILAIPDSSQVTHSSR